MSEGTQKPAATLPKEVAEKYEITGGIPIGKIRVSPQFGGREFDLPNISLAEADKLHASKFPHIKVKESWQKAQEAKAKEEAKAPEKGSKA